MKFLETGAADFIGSDVCSKLCEAGHNVVGLDNLNDYYEVELKQTRLDSLASFSNFRFIRLNLEDRPGMAKMFSEEAFDRVIHLAAQAGVRYSIDNPFAYVDSNIDGMMTILEGCRNN